MTRIRLTLSFIAGCTAAIALYAILRFIQTLLLKEPDPALVIWSEHAGYFWRSWTVAYAGGMVAFVVWLVSRKEGAIDRIANVLVKLVTASFVLIALQGLLLP